MIFERLFQDESVDLISIDYGFTSSNQDSPDGEPHLCLRFTDGLAIEELRELASQFGQTISNNFLAFPEGINANFYSQAGDSFRLVTHERNLGFVAERCITQSCGTGSTVVGAIRIDAQHGKQQSRDISEEIVSSLGGDLIIERENQALYSSLKTKLPKNLVK